ncbi:MAG: hypothetical protein IKQ54_00055 [Oscillospiraceae bacterium]|nr:hypothetical protein [Oscillospiraceae bacterium]
MQYDIQSIDRVPLSSQLCVDIDDRCYVIDQCVGTGGFALTYLAHRANDSHRVALKELFPRRSSYGVVERAPSGKIEIYDPITGVRDDPAAWQEMVELFRHEVEMARRAEQVFGEDGSLLAQNNRDVLHSSGPYQDSRGNWYVLLDTAQGFPFHALIERGFLRDRNRVLTNGYLKEILEILIGVARRLSVLHHTNRLLHLDLSPGNIYLVSVEGGTELRPHIIDYGSALECAPAPTGHRYTFNQFSAPEIAALADLDGEPSDFYRADESSDTYSLVSILYYALTGEIYSARTLFDRSWEQRISAEYGTFETEGEQAFSNELISLLRKGLSAAQERRFRSADELCVALTALAAHLPDLLCQLSPAERMSSVLLDRWPLYRYRDEDGDIHVLCLGDSAFVFSMILSMLSVGQLLDSRLYIHAVSADGEALRASLRTQAPTLAQYSNLDADRLPQAPCYVFFTFTSAHDLTDEVCCHAVCKAFSRCRYIVVSLGDNRRNMDVGRMAAKCFSDEEEQVERIVLYYNEEDVARNTRGTVSLEGIRKNVHLLGFGERSGEACAQTKRTLGRSALRLAHLYDKIYDPRVSLRSSAKLFMRDAYTQRACVASALHLRYKLASLGIDPDGDWQEVISAYDAAIKSRKDSLLVLEHRRWLMYMIAEGYRRPTLAEMESYAFRNGVKGFKHKGRKLHNCLLPFEDGTRKLRQLTHEQWDRYDVESIATAPFDEFDRLSLRLHLLARQIAQGEVGGTYPLLHDCRELVRYLGDIEPLQLQYARLAKALSELQQTMIYSGESEQLDLLETAFEQYGIDAKAEIQKIRFDLEVFREYHAYKDYKESDEETIAYLPWLLYGDRDFNVVKLCGRTLVDDLLAPLILNPTQLVYYGTAEETRIERLRVFLRKHGLRCDVVRYAETSRTQLADALHDLERLCLKRDNCVIDITGCKNEIHLAAAIMLSEQHPDISVSRCNESNQSVTNVRGFDEASMYRINTGVSAEEAFGLYGAVSSTRETQYMRLLYLQADRLWNFYQKHKDHWQMISAFFANYGAGGAELYLRRPEDTKAPWQPLSFLLPKSVCASLNLYEGLSALEKEGFLKNLEMEENEEFVTVRFACPSIEIRRVYSFFQHLSYPFARFSFHYDPQNDAAMLQSGSFVYVSDRSQHDVDHRQSLELCGKTQYEYRQMLPILLELEQLQLIRGLDSVLTPDDPSGTSRIQFYYASAAVKEFFSTSGNALALIVWKAAKSTGRFDDCRPNFFFQWTEKTVTDELDLILTKGLSTLLVFCRTGNINRQHLYELRYLADRFSVGSKAVIVYSSDTVTDDNERLLAEVSEVKARAKAMEIYLIDMYKLQGDAETTADRLGATFVSILEDQVADC